MSNATDLISQTRFSYSQYDGFTSEQCLALPPEQQVDCSGQHLNITDPPSIYLYTQYSSLWQPAWCMLWNVTLAGRVDNQDNLNFCTVPLRGSDGFLFLSLALLVSACCFGKLASVVVLCIGGILGTINYYANLLQIGNAISIWLAIQPADLFFYAFIPPLVVEETIRIDLFLLRKGWVHVLMLAYLLVGLTVIALTPIILYALQFKDRGWSWVHAALFGAIIAPTDTVAVAAIMASSNAPAKLSTILRGESVFNDASGITLFGIFAAILAANATPGSASTWPSVWSTLPGILLDLLRTTAVGVGIGLAMSWATHRLLRLLRWRGASPYIDTTVVLAVAYLCYYVANSPAKGSGVIAVVCFGLYGNATSKWGMLATVEDNGSFDAVWDMVAFAANGLVFFWSGIAAVNFLIRTSGLLTRTPASFIAIPVIYIAMILIRVLCIVLFNPLFKFMGQGFTPSEIIFTGFASMRGSVSLIMASGFAVGSSSIYTGSDANTSDGTDDAGAINAEFLLWTASFVVITLVVNGSLCGPILRILNLCKVSKERNRTRSRAKKSLREFTEDKVVALKQSKENEFLAGANWDLVERYVEVSPIEMEGFDDEINDSLEDEKKEGGRGFGFGSGTASAARARAVDTQSLLGVLYTLGSAALNYFQAYFARIFNTAIHTGSKFQIKRIKYNGNFTIPKPPPTSGCPISPMATPTVVVQLSAPTPRIPVDGSSLSASEDPKQQEHHHSHRDETSHLSAGWSENSGAFEEMDWTQAERVECPFLPSTTDKGREENRSSLQEDGEGQKTPLPPVEPIDQDGQHDGIEAQLQQQQFNDIESNYNDEGLTNFNRRKTSQPAGVDDGEIEIEEASTQSMPAAVGRGMRAELQRELGRVGITSISLEMNQSNFDFVLPPYESTSGASTSAAAAASAVAPINDFSEAEGALHGATVSGASGAALAAELKRQLNLTAETRSTPSLPYNTPRRSSILNPSGRDLLGRKASGSASPRPLQFLGFGVNPPSPSFSGSGSGGGGVRNSVTSTNTHYQRDSVFSSRDRAVLPATAPLAAALLDQRLGALQRQQDEHQQQQHQRNASIANLSDSSASTNENNPLPFTAAPPPPPSTTPFITPTEEVLYEEKSRVVSGLKRHFTARRLEGLLSSRGLRLLEYACDEILEDMGSSLRLWPILEAEVRGGWAARGASRLSLFTLSAYRSMPGALHKLCAWPLKKLSAILRRYLGRKMLVACEVAVELYLALTSIFQVAWLKQEQHGSMWRCLLEDIESDTCAAHHFIIQREIEAPDLFQAIQSYRSAMAVLRQQVLFCQNLFQTGAVDAAELQGLTTPIDRKIRHLEMVGPVWRPPRPKAVLKSLSLVTALSNAAFRRFYATGSILDFTKGQLIWDSSRSSWSSGADLKGHPYSCPGLYIILSGVVKRVLKTESNQEVDVRISAQHTQQQINSKEYFQGPGCVVGALPCILEISSVSGEKMAGTTWSPLCETVVAEGNALGRGPVVFHLPRTALHQLLPLEEFAGLREELMRLAAASLMEQHNMMYGSTRSNSENSTIDMNSYNSKIIREMLRASVVVLVTGQTFFFTDVDGAENAVLLQGSLHDPTSASIRTSPCVITNMKSNLNTEWQAGKHGATLAVAYSSANAGGSGTPTLRAE